MNAGHMRRPAGRRAPAQSQRAFDLGPEARTLDRSMLSGEFRDIIEIHERMGGSVEIRRSPVDGRGIQVRLEDGEWRPCMDTSIIMSKARRTGILGTRSDRTS